MINFLANTIDRYSLLSLEIYIFNAAFLTFTLISSLRKLSKSVENRNFIFFMFSVLLSIIFDMFCFYFDEYGTSNTRILNSISNVIYIFLSIIISYFWLSFIMKKLGYKTIENKLFLWSFRCIIFIHSLLAFLSIWTGLLFYIDENGIYQRGNLFFLQLTPWLFIVFANVLTFKRIFDKKEVANIKFNISIILFTLFPIVTETFQIFGSGSPSLSIGYSMGTLFMYIILLEDNISADGLTGLNNRQFLTKYLIDKVKHIKKDDEVYFIIMDINDFKKINDTYGHIEGDKALVIFSKCLSEIEKEHQAYVARYGGDEFVIVLDNASEAKVKEVMENLNSKLIIQTEENNLKYKLFVSYGYTKCYSSDIYSIEKMISRADGLLYLDKNNYREAKNRQ